MANNHRYSVTKIIYTIISGRNRRRDRRMLIPELTVEIDGGFYPTQDWSMGGFRVSGYHGELSVGDRFAARMFGTIRGRQVEARVFATVVRVDRTSGDLAASYYAFEHRAFETLERFATRQLRRRA